MRVCRVCVCVEKKEKEKEKKELFFTGRSPSSGDTLRVVAGARHQSTAVRSLRHGSNVTWRHGSNVTWSASWITYRDFWVDGTCGPLPLIHRHSRNLEAAESL